MVIFAGYFASFRIFDCQLLSSLIEYTVTLNQIFSMCVEVASRTSRGQMSTVVVGSVRNEGGSGGVKPPPPNVQRTLAFMLSRETQGGSPKDPPKCQICRT